MKDRRPAILLALLFTLTLAGCGGANDSSLATVTTSCLAEAPVGSGSSSCFAEAPAEGSNVTADYQDQLMGAYSGEHGMAYRFAEDGILTVADQTGNETELTEGSWWVWQEGEVVSLYTSLKGTAHPAQYTFAVSEEGVLSLYDVATGELSDRLTPYTCGVFP